MQLLAFELEVPDPLERHRVVESLRTRTPPLLVLNTCQRLEAYGFAVPEHEALTIKHQYSDAEAFQRLGNDAVHDPINFFMNIGLVEKGAFEARESLAEKNDFVLLRAEMDLLVAVTACPQDQTPINGGTPSDVLVRIYR